MAVISIVAICLLLMPGCGATFFWGNERVPVTSDPPGATVFVDGTESGATPVSLRLPRHGPKALIRIEYPGYKPVEIMTKRRIPPAAVFGDILAGAGIGFVIAAAIFMENDETKDLGDVARVSVPLCIGGLLLADSAFGRVTSPQELWVVLSKIEDVALPGHGAPGVVRTIFLNEDQFKNLRWIRVHLD